MTRVVSRDEYTGRVDYICETYEENLERVYGITTPHGWLSSVENMLSHLEVIFGKEANQVIFIDLKEKYAGAIFSWGYAKRHNLPNSDMVQKIVDQYESNASTKCQVCGAPGTVRMRGGYLVRLCVTHFDVW